MALTLAVIPATRGGNIPGMIIANGQVADEQNTGELINLTFGSIPPHRYRILEMVVSCFAGTGNFGNKDQLYAMKAVLLAGGSGELLETTMFPIMFNYLDTTPDGALQQWICKITNPFFQTLQTPQSDTIQLSAPPADPDATPQGIYQIEIKLAIED